MSTDTDRGSSGSAATRREGASADGPKSMDLRPVDQSYGIGLAWANQRVQNATLRQLSWCITWGITKVLIGLAVLGGFIAFCYLASVMNN